MPPDNPPHNALRAAVTRGVAQHGAIVEIVETLDDRLARLAHYIESTRFALTEADVRYDYETRAHRYASKGAHGCIPVVVLETMVQT